MWTTIVEPVSSLGALRMKSQVVVPVPMSIAASMITAVATTTTVTAVAANHFLNFYMN
jgi:hypothetical protein